MSVDKCALAVTILAAVCVGRVTSAAPLPVARAPFARSGVARFPAKMAVASFSWGTNLYDGVEFVSGSKRLVVSGADRSVDCNHPLRFGRLVVMDGRKCEAELWLKCRGLWEPFGAEDATLAIDKARNSATWRRAWTRPDGKKAVFSYTVTGCEDGTATIDWDMGLSLEEALAQTNALSVGSSLLVSPDVAQTARYGFGGIPHELYPREKLVESGDTQIHRAMPVRGATLFEYGARGDPEYWSLALPESWTKTMRVYDFAGSVKLDGTVRRGVTYHYSIADFRKENWQGHAVKGRLVLDFGLGQTLENAPQPPVGGLDFWAFDAVHVPEPPTRNLLMNGSFEQGFKGWRWDDWGAEYSPSDKPKEEIIEGGFAGRHAALLRGVQPKCPPLCSAPMPLVAGKKYTVSCMVKAAGSRPMNLAVRVRSVNRTCKYWQFKGYSDFKGVRVDPGEDWKRHSFTFEADAGGFYVQMQASGSENDPSNGVLVDAVQVEECEEATDFAEAPFVANLLTSNEYNDLKPGEKIDARLDVQTQPGWKGEAWVRVKNGYSEEVYSKKFPLSGDAVLPLDLDPDRLGKGIFVVRIDYTALKGGEKKRWTDYARFVIQEPLANKHATAQFYANHGWYERVSRAPHLAKKFVEWGWGSTDGRKNCETVSSHVAPLVRKLGIRNYVHPAAYEVALVRSLAAEMGFGKVSDIGRWLHSIKEVTPKLLELFETAAYRSALECQPDDDIWTFWNEEESWARKVGFGEHFKCVEACMKGVKRAFAERGLPPPRFCESHGTSHYFNGRNYDAIDGYLSAAAAKGVKYDVVTVHPYQNIDGGALGPKDADVETQHLIDQMKEHGYPDSTPIMFTECFNMHPVKIPPWGADGWGDSYRMNTKPSQDLGNMEFLTAASQMRLYIIALKYWPKVQLVHPWNTQPVMDIRFTPYAFIFSANTLGHLLPDPEYVGDAQPYRDVRGYCFRQGGKAVMPVWTTNHDVEWGVKRGATLEMDLPADAFFIDMFGNRREAGTVAASSGGKTVKVPLTPAPLFIVSGDADALLKALRESRTDDPATALSTDVRPAADGTLSLILKNETKSRQKGSVTAGGKEIAYDIGPRGEMSREIAKGTTAPMKLNEWSAAVSTRPLPWSVKWFFVPECGEKPDWSKIPAQPLETVKLGKGAKASLKAECKLAWNKDFLFVRVEAEDPDFIPVSEDGKEFAPGALYAHDGCLEVYFDAFADARSQGRKDYDLNDSRYDFLENHIYRLRAVNWQLAQGTASATDEEIREKLARKFTRTEKGYVYEIAFAARYMAPVDLKPGTVAGVGICLHDYNRGADGKIVHANLSNATEPGMDCNEKPFLWPVMVLGSADAEKTEQKRFDSHGKETR